MFEYRIVTSKGFLQCWTVSATCLVCYSLWRWSQYWNRHRLPKVCFLVPQVLDVKNIRFFSFTKFPGFSCFRHKGLFPFREARATRGLCMSRCGPQSAWCGWDPLLNDAAVLAPMTRYSTLVSVKRTLSKPYIVNSRYTKNSSFLIASLSSLHISRRFPQYHSLPQWLWGMKPDVTALEHWGTVCSFPRSPRWVPGLFSHCELRAANFKWRNSAKVL